MKEKKEQLSMQINELEDEVISLGLDTINIKSDERTELKNVYLTFYNGPSKNTDIILDFLFYSYSLATNSG